MQDQTQGLVANGIPAAAIHSNQDESVNQRIFDAAYNGRLKLLYISPERLLLELDRFRALKISLFAIDEVMISDPTIRPCRQSSDSSRRFLSLP